MTSLSTLTLEPPWSYHDDVNLAITSTAIKAPSPLTQDIDCACCPQFSYSYSTVPTRLTPPKSRLTRLSICRNTLFSAPLKGVKQLKSNPDWQNLSIWNFSCQSAKIPCFLRLLWDVMPQTEIQIDKIRSRLTKPVSIWRNPQFS